MACSGNTAEICGGSNLISVFNNTAYVYPSSPETVGSYTYLACYHEATTGRLLSGPSYSDPVNMTVESCTSFCQSNMPNGVYAGVEYSQGLFPDIKFGRTSWLWNRMLLFSNITYSGSNRSAWNLLNGNYTPWSPVSLLLWKWNIANMLVSYAKATTKSFVVGIACWMSMNMKLQRGSLEDGLVLFKYGWPFYIYIFLVSVELLREARQVMILTSKI
jgi:hypothetical protein